jgi:hypothetical protein
MFEGRIEDEGFALVLKATGAHTRVDVVSGNLINNIAAVEADFLSELLQFSSY